MEYIPFSQKTNLTIQMLFDLIKVSYLVSFVLHEVFLSFSKLLFYFSCASTFYKHLGT